MRKYRFVVVDDRSGTRDRCSQNNVDYEAKGNVNRETKSLLNIKDDWNLAESCTVRQLSNRSFLDYMAPSPISCFFKLFLVLLCDYENTRFRTRHTNLRVAVQFHI